MPPLPALLSLCAAHAPRVKALPMYRTEMPEHEAVLQAETPGAYPAHHAAQIAEGLRKPFFSSSHCSLQRSTSSFTASRSCRPRSSSATCRSACCGNGSARPSRTRPTSAPASASPTPSPAGTGNRRGVRGLHDGHRAQGGAGGAGRRAVALHRAACRGAATVCSRESDRAPVASRGSGA